jgi:predicted nucleic acid-binding protein
MIALDAGLLALAVNRYAPGHARAAALLESLAEGDAPWALPWSAVHEFLAFVTHRHAVARTLGAEDAWGFIAALSRSPSVRFLGPGPRHAAVVAEVLSLGRSREPLTLDAAFTTAVLLREHGVRELLLDGPRHAPMGVPRGARSDRGRAVEPHDPPVSAVPHPFPPPVEGLIPRFSTGRPLRGPL